MLKTKKESVVADLVQRLQTADTLIIADYRGLTHAELDGVRTKLIEQGAKLSVCKNTLTRRAAEEAGVDALIEFLTGPTAIAFVTGGDMAAVAKTLDETAKSTRRLALKGAVLSGRAIGEDAVKTLASLPPVDVLRGQVLGAIVAPLSSMLALVNAPLQNLVGLIDARIDQLGGAEAEKPAAPETPAEEAPAEEAPTEEPQAEADAEAEPAAEEAPAEEPQAEADAEAEPAAEEAPAASDEEKPAAEAAGDEETTTDGESEENQ